MKVKWYHYFCGNCDHHQKRLNKLSKRCEYCGRYTRLLKVEEKEEK